MTPTAPRCSECGAVLPIDAPRGACPRCLLLRAFESLPADEPVDPRATVHLVLPEEPDRVLPFSEIGDYELLQEIGRGGMGVIYQARQRSLDRIVALKLIRAGALAKADGVARFKQEAAATARLRHSGIVAVHEVGEHEGQHFYSMDFVPGRSLAAALRDGPYAPRPAAECVRAVAEAIHFAHERGVIHRDLKPSNVLLDHEGAPRVSDFGLAKLLQSDSELTLSGAVLGSPSYMPPEQARGQHTEVSARSDVYALGAILYECLTGRPPFAAATPLETMKLVVEQDAIAPRVINPALPRDLETICLKCLQKDPAHRYPAAQALADELGRFLRNEPIQARPNTLLERFSKWAYRHPARAALAALAFVAPAAIITVLLVMGTKLRRERNIAVQYELATRERAYAADMYATFQALAVDNLALARQLLHEHSPTRIPTSTSPAAPNFKLGTGSSSDLRGFEWRALWERARGQEFFAFTNLARAAECLAFAPDGRTLVSGGGNGIHLWDILEHKPRGVFPGPDPGLTPDIAPTMEQLRPMLNASPAVSEYVKVWPAIFDYLDALAHTNRTRGVTSVGFSPDGKHLLSGGRDFVRSWNFETRLFEFAVPEMDATVAAPAGNEIFVVGNDQFTTRESEGRSAHPRSVLSYSFTTRRLVAELPGYGWRVAVSPDGRCIAAASQTKGVVLWHPSTGETERIGHDPRFDGLLAFSPDGQTLLVGSDSRRPMLLLDVASKRILAYLKGEQLHVAAVAWSADGQLLAGGGKDQTIGIWTVPPRGPTNIDEQGPPLLSPRRILHGHEGTLNALTFSPDGRWLASAANDHSIRLWAVTESIAALPQAAPSSHRPLPVFAADPATGCIVGRREKELGVWDVQSGYSPHFLPGTEQHFHAGFLARGAGFVTVKIATNGAPVQLSIRRLPDGAVQTQRELLPPPNQFEPAETSVPPHLAAASDGRWLAIGQEGRDNRKQVYIYAIDSGQFVTRLPALWHGILFGLRTSPDSRWLVRLDQASGENLIAIYDTANWRLAREIRFHSAGFDVAAATIDPTSRFIATGGADENSLRIWDLFTGGLAGRCNGVAGLNPVWSRDGRTLVVWDGNAEKLDGRLRLWSMIVFRELAAFPLEWHPMPFPLGFTPDDRALVGLTANHEIRPWSPPTLAEIDRETAHR